MYNGPATSLTLREEVGPYLATSCCLWPRSASSQNGLQRDFQLIAVGFEQDGLDQRTNGLHAVPSVETEGEAGRDEPPSKVDPRVASTAEIRRARRIQIGHYSPGAQRADRSGLPVMLTGRQPLSPATVRQTITTVRGVRGLRRYRARRKRLHGRFLNVTATRTEPCTVNAVLGGN